MTSRPRNPVTVVIDGGGHRVELTAHTTRPSEVTDLARSVYDQTKSQPRAGIGFGSQHIERAHDRPVAGAGAYATPIDPATASE